MEAIRVFQNGQFGEIRTSIENGQPLFFLSDICRALDIGNVSQCKSTLDEDGIITNEVIDSLGRTQAGTFVNESNFYQVVFQSRKPEAKQFKKWVTSEVLPSIRKHGAYATEQTIESMLANPENAIKVFTALKEERTKRQIAERVIEVQETQLKELAPKAQYTEKVLQSTETYATTRIAQELGMSAIALNKKLHEKRVQRKVDGQWVLYAQFLDKGFAKSHTVPYPKSDGTTGSNTQTVWTEKGRLFIHEIFNSIPQ